MKSIEMDGLLWGATKKVPIGYGISKLQVVCTVEDDKVSVDDLQEKIQGFEDHVQSVDIVACKFQNHLFNNPFLFLVNKI